MKTPAWMSLMGVALLATSLQAQQVVDPGFKSVGRGWPLNADATKYKETGPTFLFGPQSDYGGTAHDGAMPPGIQPLPVDIFTFK